MEGKVREGTGRQRVGKLMQGYSSVRDRDRRDWRVDGWGWKGWVRLAE